MAIKKSQLYSSLWLSCNELPGGMDSSQYKDYVLSMLFIKDLSYKYAEYDGFESPVVIHEGVSFVNMVALKGKGELGASINTRIIEPLIDASQWFSRSDFADFDGSNKLGERRAMVNRLTNLFHIFQKPELDSVKYRTENDQLTATHTNT